MKGNMKKNLPYYFILFSAIGIGLPCFSPLHAQEKTARWSVITHDGATIEADSMYIRESDMILFRLDGDSSAIVIDSIRQVNELTNGNSLVRGALTGGVVLGTVGFITGRLLDTERSNTVYFPYFQVFPRNESNLPTLLAGGGLIAGSVIGGVLGSKSNDTRTYALSDMTPDEKKSRLNSLLKAEETDELWEQRPVHVAISVARTFPLGDFSDATPSNSQSGAAKPGISGRVEVFRKFPGGIEFVGSISHTVHSVDPAVFGLPYGLLIGGGTWHTTWVLAGTRFPASLSPNTTLYGSVELGAIIGSTPETDITLYGVNIRQESSTATSWGAGLAGGIRFGNRLVIEGRYLYSKPTYTISATTGSTTITGEAIQPTAMFQISVGVIGW